MDVNDRPRNVWKPSSIAASYIKQSNNAEANEIYGEKELRIGDCNHLKITFPTAANNLKFHYYQVENYTKEDAAFTGVLPKDLEYQDLFFEFKAFFNKNELIHLQVPPGFDNAKWGVYSEKTFTSVIFLNTAIGSLHIDRISWDPA